MHLAVTLPWHSGPPPRLPATSRRRLAHLNQQFRLPVTPVRVPATVMRSTPPSGSSMPALTLKGLEAGTVGGRDLAAKGWEQKLCWQGT